MRKKRPKTDERFRTEIVALRVTAEEKATLEQISDRLGISPSKLIRTFLEPVIGLLGPIAESPGGGDGGDEKR